MAEQQHAGRIPSFGSRQRGRHEKARNRIRLLGLLFLATCLFAICYQIGFLLALKLNSSEGPYLRGGLQSEADRESLNTFWSKPDDWESYGYYKTRKHFQCKAYAHDQTKPLPTLEHWDLLKKTFREVVDQTAVFDDPVPPTKGYSLRDGGPPPYYAGHSADGRGRGLFASRNIKKGELVHDGTNSDIMFPDGMSWRRFIFSLPRNRACDMIDWTWTQKLEDGKLHLFSAMNISILMNTGHKSKKNIQPESNTSSKFYALRDIAKDEEILMDYGEYETVWSKVGL